MKRVFRFVPIDRDLPADDRIMATGLAIGGGGGGGYIELEK